MPPCASSKRISYAPSRGGVIRPLEAALRAEGGAAGEWEQRRRRGSAAAPVGEPDAEHGAADARDARAEQQPIGAPGLREDVVVLRLLGRGWQRVLRGDGVHARPRRDTREDERNPR